MNQNLWEMMVTINGYLNPLREADTPSTVAMIDLVELRSKLRSQLEDLRSAVTEQYSERDSYFVLFPLTAHCDEVVKKMILDINHLEWPSLQQELYQVADAGDLFYELLDNALSKPETLPLVYEVYYFCLNDGFSGRYTANPDRLAGYLQKLRKHILLQPVVTIAPPLSVPTRRLYFRIPNYVYYCGAGALLMLVYAFLTVLASSWQPLA
ncbi:DotU family type IV/VI secretion system protein [Methylobacter sp. S3L5C]|uniref:DotU family type IV/VI secretion system protein n=1 Tax=Methylobacter sp. S3L5C TaxID=2839024 RepID=UPI001FAD779B|nr:DotU family type IV/VI secretion system protein [Methylobacter sp. S3L5C]UOA10466.1 DotU family type IV/VI secretion system protein [Methylobacter sp. S3L5C]